MGNLKYLNRYDNVDFYEIRFDSAIVTSRHDIQKILFAIQSEIKSEVKIKAILLTDIVMDLEELEKDVRKEEISIYLHLTLVLNNGETNYANVQVITKTKTILDEILKPKFKFIPFIKEEPIYEDIQEEFLNEFFDINVIYMKGIDGDSYKKQNRLKFSEIINPKSAYIIHYNGNRVEILAQLVEALKENPIDISEVSNHATEKDVDINFLESQKLQQIFQVQYHKLNGMRDKEFKYLKRYKEIKERLESVESATIFKQLFKPQNINTPSGKFEYLTFTVKNDSANYKVNFMLTYIMVVNYNTNEIKVCNLDDSQVNINQFVDLFTSVLPLPKEVKYTVKNDLNFVYDHRKTNK